MRESGGQQPGRLQCEQFALRVDVLAARWRCDDDAAGLHADTADRQGSGCRTQAEEVAAERRGVHGRQRDADEPGGAHRRHARSELVDGRPLPGHRADTRVHPAEGDRRRGSALAQFVTAMKKRGTAALFFGPSVSFPPNFPPSSASETR